MANKFNMDLRGRTVVIEKILFSKGVSESERTGRVVGGFGSHSFTAGIALSVKFNDGEIVRYDAMTDIEKVIDSEKSIEKIGKEGNKMTVKDLKQKLNEAIATKQFQSGLKKIVTHSAFHVYINRQLAHLLPNNLGMAIWGVSVDKNLQFVYKETKVLSYTREFTPYKNSSKNQYAQKGHFTNVQFVECVPEELLVTGIRDYFTAKQKEEQINNLTLNIQDMEVKLAEAKKQLAELMTAKH